MGEISQMLTADRVRVEDSWHGVLAVPGKAPEQKKHNCNYFHQHDIMIQLRAWVLSNLFQVQAGTSRS